MEDSYPAYCLDEAVMYFGLTLENKLDEAGHKPTKAEKKAQAERERILQSVLNPSGEDQQKGTGFADPALMFK